MFEFCGKGIYGAFAIGRAVIFKNKVKNISKGEICDIAQEKDRLIAAKEKASAELDLLYQKTLSSMGQDNAQIFEIHKMLLDDEDFSDTVNDIIENEHVSAEYAVFRAGEIFSEQFFAMQDSYMKERANDIKDISKRLINALTQNESDNSPALSGAIICAEELTPSETANLDKEKTLAFLTERGGYNSHTAILARSMNIPAVSGLPTDFFERVQDGDMLCVDGYSGRVVLLPDEATLKEFADKEACDIEEKELLASLRGKENITRDGKKIAIYANIGSEHEVTPALENDAGGIGLLRSEFSYLERTSFPTEDELFASYKNVLSKMQGKKVIIRTLDIGADKQADYFNIPSEENPALGMRGVRISISRPEIFRVQMRAIFRASSYGRLGVMFPMINSEEEVRELLDLCDKIKDELRAEGAQVSDNIEIGIMVETPAAAIISDRLAPLVDFFSVGTNDLTQYTLACDRQNSDIERFANPYHEAIFRQISMCAESIHANGGWIGICGELASDTTVTKRFLEIGIDELSVSPTHILRLRKAVLEI